MSLEVSGPVAVVLIVALLTAFALWLGRQLKASVTPSSLHIETGDDGANAKAQPEQQKVNSPQVRESA